MCGFVWFSFEDKDLLKKSSKTLKARAIDDEYFYYENNLSFFHAHLKVSDLDKNTSQPFFYKNLVIWLVWEIYNKKRLLEISWINWDEKDFTELQTIWFCYEKYWKDFINYVNWEFSIFIYDKVLKKYFLYRDRWGTNNIYYKIKNKKLYFASEIKSLIFENPEINKNAFVEFMTFQFCISPNTIVKDIFSLRPWTYLEFDANWKYFINDFKKYEYQEENENIIKAVENSIIRRIPIFQDKIFLSLSWWPDSNLILYFLNKYYKWEIIAYSFFTEKNLKEIEIAKNNTKKLWVKHILIDWENIEFDLKTDIYNHEWLVNLPNLWKIIKDFFPEYKNVKVEFWWDWKEELILWNNHYPYREIISRYKYFKDKNLIKDFEITQEFLNKEMFDYNLQMIDKITLRNWIERRMPFTDYELLKYYKYKNYRNEAKAFLNSNWIEIVDWEFWYNLWIWFKNLYDKDLIERKNIFLNTLNAIN